MDSKIDLYKRSYEFMLYGWVNLAELSLSRYFYLFEFNACVDKIGLDFGNVADRHSYTIHSFKYNFARAFA